MLEGCLLYVVWDLLYVSYVVGGGFVWVVSMFRLFLSLNVCYICRSLLFYYGGLCFVSMFVCITCFLSCVELCYLFFVVFRSLMCHLRYLHRCFVIICLYLVYNCLYHHVLLGGGLFMSSLT